MKSPTSPLRTPREIDPLAPSSSVPPPPRRHRQVLQSLLRGLSEKEVALELGISRHTVHVYVTSLYRRFAVCSRAELMAAWIETEPRSGQTSDPTKTSERWVEPELLMVGC